MEDADCDHVLALDEGGTNSLDNFQLLCRTPCHQEKSNDEAFRASYDTLESRFCPSVYEAYVSSPKTLPLVFQNHPPPEARELLMLDCIRCRKNALSECAVPLPVFSPLDSIEPCNQTLGDMTFIDAPAPKNTGELLQKLPFQGAGWYTQPAAQWLLHSGVVTWTHCTHVLNASARHPPDYLKTAITTM